MKICLDSTQMHISKSISLYYILATWTTCECYVFFWLMHMLTTFLSGVFPEVVILGCLDVELYLQLSRILKPFISTFMCVFPEKSSVNLHFNLVRSMQFHCSNYFGVFSIWIWITFPNILARALIVDTLLFFVHAIVALVSLLLLNSRAHQ